MACPVKNHLNGSSVSWIRPDLPPKCEWELNSSQVSPHNHYRNELNANKSFNSVLEAIGNTPMVRLERLEKLYNLECELYAKCEFFNAGGSVKDRIGLRMIEEAERSGVIKPNMGYTIIEPTSGNTGIGLALTSAVKGYRCIIVLPEKMSQEKVNVLKALGAEIVRTPTAASFDHPTSHVRVAQKLQKEIPKAVILDQYRNPGNPVAHYDTTSVEILEQLNNHVDAVVMGAGTGGTISGIGRRLKEKCPSCKVVGVDPEGSDLALPVELNQTETSFYEVEGIGYDFIPSVLDRSVVDIWMKSNDKESLLMARTLIRVEGLLCGGSSGASASCGIKFAKKMKKGEKCVILLPDSIRNYMTKHLMTDWMIEREFLPLPEEATTKWWATKCVSDMTALNIPLSVRDDVSCEEAFKLMKDLSYDQLPVIGKAGQLVGVVTTSDMTVKLACEKITEKSLICEAMISEYKKIKDSTKLWIVSKLLEKEKFLIVTGTSSKYDLYEHCDNNLMKQVCLPNQDGLCGIISSADFYLYLTSFNKKQSI